MNPIRFLLTLIAALLSFPSCFADDYAKWVTFGEGAERERFANCFIVRYPSSFTVDPHSGISPSRSFGKLPIPEENLHCLILHDQKHSLEVRVSSYGFLTQEFYTPRGFASPREVILTDFFSNALNTRITKMQDFDLFYSETASEVVAIYLNRKANWRSCYQSLTFSFRKGTTLEDHAKVVERIVARFVPGFARQK